MGTDVGIIDDITGDTWDDTVCTEGGVEWAKGGCAGANGMNGGSKHGPVALGGVLFIISGGWVGGGNELLSDILVLA